MPPNIEATGDQSSDREEREAGRLGYSAGRGEFKVRCGKSRDRVLSGWASQIQHPGEDLQVGISITKIRRVDQPGQIEILVKVNEESRPPGL
jgi:hypothetical protein